MFLVFVYCQCSFLPTELCTLLVKTKSFEALQVFLEALPDRHSYGLNENFVRANIDCALFRKDTRVVYNLIEENTFQGDTEDLISKNTSGQSN